MPLADSGGTGGFENWREREREREGESQIKIKSNQIYFSTTFNITFMCTLLHYYNLKLISIMIVNV